MDAGNPENVKLLFSKCLLTCLDVDLWRTYLRFVNQGKDSQAPETLLEMRQAYEFALDRIGQDVRSGPIWQDYINFLASPKPKTPEHDTLYGAAPEGQEDAPKLAALRRAYHRALVVPTAALDSLWQGYERFENSTGNKTLAKRSIDEWRPKFQSARSTLKERMSMVDRLDMRALPLPPGRGKAKQAQQAAAWHEIIQYERSNPQDLDIAVYQARVVLIYEQALTVLLYYPDIWLDYASWHTSSKGSGAEAAKAILMKGKTALPLALILHFTAAEYAEIAGDVEGARSVYEELLGRIKGDDSLETTTQSSQQKSEGNQPDTAAPAAVSQEDSSTAPEKNLLDAEQGTLVWIQYMRFARRVEGLMAARKLFLRARKWSALRWEGFVASAQMEWTSEGKEQIPRNIYELGLKTYISQPDYVLNYISFLKGLGDWANARALFERAIPECPADSVVCLWDAYLEFEMATGTLAAVKAIEQRRQEACSSLVQKVSDAQHIATLKFSYLGLLPVLPFEASQQDDNDSVLTTEPLGATAREQWRPRTFATKGEGRGHAEGKAEDQLHEPGRHHHHHHHHHHVQKPSRELEQLIASLPPTVDGPVPDIERVIEVILRMDFSPEGIRAHEVLAAKERRRQRQASGQIDGPAGGAKRRRQGTLPEDVAGNVDGGKGESDSEDDQDDDYYYFDESQQGMRGEQEATGQGDELQIDEDDALLVGGDVYKRRMRAKG